MKIAGFYDESISNGEGWRAVLFVSGCPHHCPGCHNPEAQNYDYGKDFNEQNEQEILNKIKENSILKGITISGGEPLCKENVSTVHKFIRDVKSLRPEFNIWCYSGYTLDELVGRNDTDTSACLKDIDVLVDGEFIQAKKDPTLKFRGSSNQRIIDVQNSLKEHKCVEYSKVL